MLLFVNFENNYMKDKVFQNARIYHAEIEKDAMKRDHDLAIKLRTNRLKLRKTGHGPQE